MKLGAKSADRLLFKGGQTKIINIINSLHGLAASRDEDWGMVPHLDFAGGCIGVSNSLL
jgi:hypothetical protein